jgi:hypothetical protein
MTCGIVTDSRSTRNASSSARRSRSGVATHGNQNICFFLNTRPPVDPGGKCVSDGVTV